MLLSHFKHGCDIIKLSLNVINYIKEKNKSDIRHQWVDMDDVSGKRNNDIKILVLSFRKIFGI